MNTLRTTSRAPNKYDADQRRFLQDQLERFVKRNGRDRWIDDDHLLDRAPFHIRRCRGIMKRFINAERKRIDAPKAARQKIATRIEEEMLFGDPRKALAMLRAAKKNG